MEREREPKIVSVSKYILTFFLVLYILLFLPDLFCLYHNIRTWNPYSPHCLPWGELQPFPDCLSGPGAKWMRCVLQHREWCYNEPTLSALLNISLELAFFWGLWNISQWFDVILCAISILKTSAYAMCCMFTQLIISIYIALSSQIGLKSLVIILNPIWAYY